MDGVTYVFVVTAGCVTVMLAVALASMALASSLSLINRAITRHPLQGGSERGRRERMERCRSEGEEGGMERRRSEGEEGGRYEGEGEI